MRNRQGLLFSSIEKTGHLIRDKKLRHVYIDKYSEEHIHWSILKLTLSTNFTGFPSISILCCLSNECFPIGVFSRGFSEALLYQVGNALDKSLNNSTYKRNINVTHLMNQ